MRKKRRKTRKKILAILIPFCIILILGGLIYWGYTIFFKEKDKKFLETINTSSYADLTSYAIYGIHLNIEGSIVLEVKPETINLVLSNGKDETELPWQLDIEDDTYHFKTSQYINEGINLEKLPLGEYYLLIKTTSKDENDKDVISYYSVENKTTYKNLEYYTLTNNHHNNKIDIEWNTYEECPTLRFTLKETTLPENVYDITIDPGHGGYDSGMTGCDDGSTPSVSTGYCYSGNTIKESDMNLETSLKLKEKLEAMGYKVTMTRYNKTDDVDIYDPMGSATMANDTLSKFNFAIHHNSSGVSGGVSYLKGMELYIANDTSLDFANIILESVKTKAHTVASSKSQYAVADGIYQRFFTEYEISQDDVQPSNKTTNDIWYYNIREIGGISTHATNDGRYIPVYPKNEHYDSNNTAEPFLLELGYMDNHSDLLNIMNNHDGYAVGIASALEEYLAQE